MIVSVERFCDEIAEDLEKSDKHVGNTDTPESWILAAEALEAAADKMRVRAIQLQIEGFRKAELEKVSSSIMELLTPSTIMELLDTDLPPVLPSKEPVPRVIIPPPPEEGSGNLRS
jgi:hypothetical protein